MEEIEHDLKRFVRKRKISFSLSETKCLLLQLLHSVKFLHDNRIVHRHLKTSNLLLSDRGELKIRPRPMKSEIHCMAPEILLGTTHISTAADMWSVGCVMAELISTPPLFDGKTQAYQIDKIFRMLGTPNDTIWPGFSLLPMANKVHFYKQKNLLRKKFFPAGLLPLLSDAGFDLLNRFLTYDPEKRITVDAALNHEWFRELPLPKSKENMPVFPAQDDDRRLLKQRVTNSGDSSVEAQIY